MKIKDLKKEDLDVISYDDLAYMILSESKRKMKISDLFKKVCAILKLDDNIFETKIAEFFELLSTDKKFIMLEKGYWDLREKHTHKIKIETEEEDGLTDATIQAADEEEEGIENIFSESDETEDQVDNDLNDLVIVSDEDEETDSLL